MPFQPVPETAEFRMQYTLQGQRCENVFHVRNQGAWDAAKLNEIAGTFAGWWTTIGKAQMHNSVTLQRVVGKDISAENGIGVEYTQGLPATGTLAGNPLPNNCALAVKWGTGISGRGFRGRTFHFGMTSEQLDPTRNAVQAGVQTAIRSAYDALRTALDNATLGVEFVVVSRWYNKVLRMPAITTPISGVSVEPTIDSMRRRLPGRGQ